MSPDFVFHFPDFADEEGAALDGRSGNHRSHPLAGWVGTRLEEFLRDFPNFLPQRFTSHLGFMFTVFS